MWNTNARFKKIIEWKILCCYNLMSSGRIIAICCTKLKYCYYRENIVQLFILIMQLSMMIFWPDKFIYLFIYLLIYLFFLFVYFFYSFNHSFIYLIFCIFFSFILLFLHSFMARPLFMYLITRIRTPLSHLRFLKKI